MRKYLLLTTALALMNGNAWAEVIDSGKCGDNCTWTYDDETKTIKIDGTGKMDDSQNTSQGSDYYTLADWGKYKDATKNIIIQGVEHIGAFSFQGFGNVEKITMSNTITGIGSSAFSRINSIKELIISDSVTSIGSYAFDRIPNLQKMVIPDSITSIVGQAFEGSLVKNVRCSGGGDTTKCNALLKRGGKSGVQSVSRPSYKMENGKIVERYAYDENENQYITATYEYDESGKIIERLVDGRIYEYDANWNFLRYTRKNTDGSTSIYNKDGNLVGIKGKKIYTVEEAEAVTAHGDKFHVSLTYK